MKSTEYGPIFISRIAFMFILTVFICFVAASSISSVKKEWINFRQFDINIRTLPTDAFVKLLEFENAYFGQTLSEEPESITKMLVESTLQFKYGDLRSFFGNELPGLSMYHTEILISRDGTDYTNLPYESAPPLDDLLQEREMAQKELEELHKEDPKTPPVNLATDRKVLIYHSHSYESYLPLLGLTGDPDMNKAVDSKTNITLVGDLLGKELEKYGIGSVVDTTNIGQELKKKGWDTTQSYAISRGIVQSAMASNSDIDFLIDLHRDSMRKDVTTVSINNKPYAKVLFVVGKASSHFEQSYALAESLDKAIESQFPGISRGVVAKGLNQGNGVYNQDLAENSILIEIGGVDNDMKELKNTVEALAKVICEHIIDAEKVNASHE
ncbi:stage II sporulation protein P [Fredinandcohnia sp. QZ13]|uniref:stage II sporulation protein P n=1 Tax=Fredinandcohnia sp. QZ13 TaxID=3073144 RepID=UPI00285326C8|nr:stage II sporulation protein P [Fredinandcohnia sp. QZ13]MDR4889710.1 stage II sporulation protein P [Fredinandcohnia sp. QZ13]